MTKSILALVIFSLMLLSNPAQASDQWTSGGWSIKHFDLPDFTNIGFSIVSTEDSVDFVSNVTLVDFDTTPPPYDMAFGAAYANNPLSLNKSFRLDVNYHQDLDLDYPFYAMAVGFGNHSASAPFFWDEYTAVSPEDAVYNSRNGSIRIEYDADLDRLDHWISSEDPDNVLIEEYLGSIDNFKDTVGSDSVLVAFNVFNIGEDVQAGDAGFSDLKVVAAPEPISSLLFLAGGGVMGLKVLRRRKTVV